MGIRKEYGATVSHPPKLKDLPRREIIRQTSKRPMITPDPADIHRSEANTVTEQLFVGDPQILTSLKKGRIKPKAAKIYI